MNAVRQYSKTSDLPKPDIQLCSLDIRRWLKYYANLAIIAGSKQLLIQTLRLKAVQIWVSLTNVCRIATFSFKDMLALVQHVCRYTQRDDNGIRVAVLRFAASYRHKFHLRMHMGLSAGMIPSYNACLSCPDRSVPSDFVLEGFGEERQQLDKLEGFLQSEDPLAWHMVKSYESTPPWVTVGTKEYFMVC